MSLDIRSRRVQELIQSDKANLSLQNARAGHNLNWKLFLTAVAVIASFISELINLLAAVLIASSYKANDYRSLYFAIAAILIQMLLLILVSTYRFSLLYISPIVLIFATGLIGFLFEENSPDPSINGFFLSLSIGLILSIIGTIATAQHITFIFLINPFTVNVVTIFVSFIAILGLAWISVSNSPIATLERFTLTLIAIVNINIAGVLVGRKALKGSSGFVWMRIKAVFWAAVGGTSFYNLDLSEVNLTGSMLKNTDLRARNLYRTCFKHVKGLENSRVDHRYLDLDDSRVQTLLVSGCSDTQNFSHLNLQGAYLQGAYLQNFKLNETNLNGADLRGADLRGSVLLRVLVTDVDFTGANLTGACIKDWSFNSKTLFDRVICDYIYREYEDDRPTDRYPADRNFEPGEFQSLFQKLTNAVELVFKDQVDWRALSFTFEKFRVEDEGMELELQGVEQRGDYWIVKVTHREGVTRQQVEKKVTSTYEAMRGLLAAKDQEINRLVGINDQIMGIMQNQTATLQNQSEAIKNYSKQPFGNSFYITGSTITNLAGSGEIEYAEAAKQVRSVIAQGNNPAQMSQSLQQLLRQFQSIAATPEQQAELLQQLILSEAESDEIFKGFLKQQGAQILQGMSPGAIASAIANAIEQIG